MNKALIQSTVPVLPSLNLHETLAFYVGKLGFVSLMDRQDYAIVGRDGAEIHFYPCEDRHIAENTSCYVRTGDTQALYEEFQGRAVELKPPEIRPWGMKELYVIDPHGNLLKFGEPA